jgi:hypothetical protein
MKYYVLRAEDHAYFCHGQNIILTSTSNEILRQTLPRHEGFVNSKPKTMNKQFFQTHGLWPIRASIWQVVV